MALASASRSAVSTSNSLPAAQPIWATIAITPSTTGVMRVTSAGMVDSKRIRSFSWSKWQPDGSESCTTHLLNAKTSPRRAPPRAESVDLGQLDAPIPGATRLSGVVVDGPGLTISSGDETGRIDASAHQIVADGLGALPGEVQIVGVAARGIGVARDLHPHVRGVAQGLSHPVEGRVGVRREFRAVRLEIHALEDERLLSLEDRRRPFALRL